MAQRNAARAPGELPPAPAITRTIPLSTRAWRGRQSVEYHAIRELDRPAAFDRTRLSIKIDLDSHEDQSSAKVERWDGATWQPVAVIPPSLMATVLAARYPHNYLFMWDEEANWFTCDGRDGRLSGMDAFEADEAELVRLASLVMGF